MPGTGVQMISADGRRRGWQRPVAIPNDVDAPGRRKAAGIVRLPTHLYWSGRDRSFDLNNIVDLRFVYEVVLSEGTDDDVRWFIDPPVLVKLWPHLYLPPHVRDAWEAFLATERGVHLGC